jgi:predicted transcriptional regulator
MSLYSLAPGETKLAELIWARAPISSGELVKLAEEEIGWKKSTTYTILKILCDKGVFRNERSVVSALLTKEAFYAEKSRKYVEDIFGGSLPRFLAAFIGHNRMTGAQLEELRRLIDEHQGD